MWNLSEDKKMKRQILISMSALCILAACTPSEKPEIQEPAENVIHFTATLAPKGENPQSKAITTGLEGGKEVLNVAWAEGEEVAVRYQTSNGYANVTATVKSVTNGVATITAYLFEAIDGGSVYFVYPATLHDSFGGIDESKLLNQNGNLTGANGVSTKFDAATGDGTIIVNGTEATLNGTISLTNQVCICKFHFDIVESYGMGGNPRNFSTPVIINDGNGHEYTITSDRTDGGPRGFNINDDIYVAMLPVSYSTVTFSTTYGPNSYSYTSTGTYLEAGKFYRNLSIQLVKGGYVYNNPIRLNLTGSVTSTFVIPDGGALMLDDATINVTDDGPGIQCEGNAIIILKGTNSVTAKKQPAIKAGPMGTTLTIQGTGTITATGGIDSAGIGIGHDDTCGAITITGGIVTANGGSKSAGIGSGYGAGHGGCGDITISGGTITAKGEKYSAGIGSGGYNSCGNITISGGTITATGGSYAAGIGSGERASCCNITINGGTVRANSGDHSAGIGSGRYASCGNITISNTVTRVYAIKGANSCSIGAGEDGSCGTVTIGGTIYFDGTNFLNDGDIYLTNNINYRP